MDEKMNILILDDDHKRLIQFKQKLIGHSVTCVETAKEAIDELKKNKFDIISLDHDLGGMQMVPSGEGTGWEVAKFLHDNPQFKPYMHIHIHSYNQIGANNMHSLLPEAILSPGNWL